MNRLLYIILLVLILSLNGCLKTNVTGSNFDEESSKPVQLKETLSELFYDPATIIRTEIRKDILKLTVRYGGGCEEHEFELYWDGLFMESHPVQAMLQLSHNSNNDLCRALITDELFFDLSLLKSAYASGYSYPSGEIIIHVQEPDTSNSKRQTVTYRFNR